MCDSCEMYACELVALEMQLEDLQRLQRHYDYQCRTRTMQTIDEDYWQKRRNEILDNKSREEVEDRIKELRYLLTH